MTFGGKTTAYTYDSQNQLIREDNQAAGYTYVWTYDNAGNILYRTRYDYTTGTLGSFQEIITYTYGNADWGDLLTRVDNSDITYDQIGNPLEYYNGYTFTWENGRQLSSINTGSATWNMTYDAGGMRTSRVGDGKFYQYVYDGDLLRRMTVNNIILDFTYDASGMPLSVTYCGTEYFYVTNLQGDVIAILGDKDAEAVVVAEYTYDTWGNLLSIDTTEGINAAETILAIINPLRYRGYVYDQETGFYYLQSRYYDPNIGRFINADSLLVSGNDMHGMNLFAYCKNSPVFSKDSSGKYVESPLDIVSIGFDLIDLAVNPTNVLSWFALGADIASLLLPGVTGGGGIVRVIASSDKLKDIVVHADDIIDAGRVMTSSLGLGADMHKVYRPVKEIVGTTFTNKSLKTIFDGASSLLRPDGINKTSKVLYELKPCNVRSLKKAVNQVGNYLEVMGHADEWLVVIDLYF